MMCMDEPDWDKETPGEPDWVYDTPREPEVDDVAVVLDERPGIGAIREQHRKAYDRWSPAADARLVAGYLAGGTVEQLAAEFERQPSAIQRRLERLAFVEMSERRTTPRGAEPN